MPVEAGARTLKEAVSAAIRDWVANVENTHYIIGSAVGPAPYPAMVRDLQRRIGDEARAQMLEAAGRLPDRVIACVGGGSNAIGSFVPFADDAAVELIGVEAAGEGLQTMRHSAPLTTGARGVLHGALSAVLQDEEGQILEAHSVSAGLDYPGVGPAARPPARHRPGRATWPWTDGEAVAAFRRTAELEGIVPALEPAHAIAWLLANPVPGHHRSSRCPGAGTRTWPRSSASDRAMSVVAPGVERIASAFAGHGKRAALMPYLMGGFPDLDASLGGGRGRGRRRAPT